MSKNSGIHHFENYIEMQKLNCILNICLNNDEVIPRAEKSRHSIRSKQNGPQEFAVRPGYSHCLHTQRR